MVDVWVHSAERSRRCSGRVLDVWCEDLGGEEFIFSRIGRLEPMMGTMAPVELPAAPREKKAWVRDFFCFALTIGTRNEEPGECAALRTAAGGRRLATGVTNSHEGKRE